MPTVELRSSPVAPEGSPARIHVREAGAGPAVVILHSGWGYEAYPFDDAIAALAPRHRVVAPDRVGYGRSGRIAALPRGFHRFMAEETLAVMDALGIREASLWGHSDGAVVAAHMAFLAPERVAALVLEATHYFAIKRAAGGRAWLDITDEGRRGRHDVYGGRLAEVRAPALLLHGRRDPRTEPGEVEAALAALPRGRIEWVDAGHSPHTSREAARAIAAAAEFLEGRGWPPG